MLLDTLNTLKVQQDIEQQVSELVPPLPEEQLAKGEVDRDTFIRDSYQYWLSHPDEETIPVTDPEAFFNALLHKSIREEEKC